MEETCTSQHDSTETRTSKHDSIVRYKVIGPEKVYAMDFVELDGELWIVSGFRDNGTVGLHLEVDRHLASEKRRRKELPTSELFRRIKEGKITCWCAKQQCSIKLGLGAYPPI